MTESSQKTDAVAVCFVSLLSNLGFQGQIYFKAFAVNCSNGNKGIALKVCRYVHSFCCDGTTLYVLKYDQHLLNLVFLMDEMPCEMFGW